MRQLITTPARADRNLARVIFSGFIAVRFRLADGGFDKRPHLGHNGTVSAVFKSRIDPKLKRQAEAVLEEIGLKPRAALELFYKQIIKRRAIPFPVQADSPEDEVLSPTARRNALADEF